MRVLKIFFASLLILLVVGLVGSFIGREVLLSMAVGQIRTAVKELASLPVAPSFIQTCLDYAGLPPETQSLVRAQLRFSSATEFVVEAVCQGSESLRYTFRSGVLPPLVAKGVTQSGLVYGQDLHGITLTVLGRTGVVYEEENLVRSSLQYNGEPALALSAGPVTVCAGYGFSCCSETSQLGQGDQQPNALDCPRSCYASCSEKPVILGFQTDPALVENSRMLQLQSGQTTQFFYTVSDVQTGGSPQLQLEKDAPSLPFSETVAVFFATVFNRNSTHDTVEKIMITFGDGQSLEVSDLRGTVEHTYTCARALCIYNATIQGVTRAGVTSTLTEDSKIQVQVSP